MIRYFTHAKEYPENLRGQLIAFSTYFSEDAYEITEEGAVMARLSGMYVITECDVVAYMMEKFENTKVFCD